MTLFIISLFLFAIFILLVFPLKSTIKLHVNVVDKVGFYSIKVLFITLLCGKIELKKGDLHILNINNKMGSVGNTKFVKVLFKKIEDVKLDIFFQAGKKDDAYLTAMLSGCVIAIINTMFASIKNVKPFFKSYSKVNSTSKTDAFMFTIFGVVYVSLLDVLTALFGSFILKGEKQNGE